MKRTTRRRIAVFISSLVALVITSTLLFGLGIGSKVAAQSTPQVPPLRTGDTVIIGTTRITMLATAADTNGKYTAAKFFVQPGGGFPPHFHSREDEVFYISKGTMYFQMEDSTIDAVNGDTLYFYADDPQAAANGAVGHIFRNNSNKPTEMILSWYPGGGIERFFAQLGTRATANTLPPTTLTPAQQSAGLSAFLTIAPTYGIVPDTALIMAGQPPLQSRVTNVPRLEIQRTTQQFADSDDDSDDDNQ